MSTRIVKLNLWLMLGVWTCAATAATLHVPGDHDTITAALAAANAGDVISVAAGTYTAATETFPLEMKTGVAVIGAGRDTTILDAQGNAANPRGVLICDAVTNARVEAFTLRGGYEEDGSGVMITGESQVTISNCLITLNTSTTQFSPSAVAIQPGAQATISNCIISNNSGNGVSLLEAQATLSQNTISSNTKSGIFCVASTVEIEQNVVEANQAYGGINCEENCQGFIAGNLIKGNVEGGLNFQTDISNAFVVRNNIITENSHTNNGSAVYCVSRASPTVVNNTLVGNIGGCAAVVSEGNAHPIIKNNLVVNTIAGQGGGLGIIAHPEDDASVILSYNNVWNNEGGDYEGCTPGTGDISVQPLFADAANADYHLMSQHGRFDPATQNWATDGVTSPCIDAGDPASDYGDEPAPNGGRINMGAYGNTAEASRSGAAQIGDFCGADFGAADGYVDIWDLRYFADRWHSHEGDANWDGQCDLTGAGFQAPDDHVDIWDLSTFSDHWHEGQQP